MIRVLHITPYFAPAFVYGGPPRSIFGLCKALTRAGVSVDVVTTTANGSGDELPAVVAEPVDLEGVRVRYFPLASPRRLWNAPLLRAALARETGSYDLVHIHGLWHLPAWDAARAARRAGVPYFVSPRGMLEREALAIHRARKLLAYGLLERRNLRRAAALHATSTRELETLERRSFGPPIVFAPNGVEAPRTASDPAPHLEALGIGRGERFVLFLGRIHPIKRLDLLAVAASKLRARDVRIVVAGPDENGTQAALVAPFARSGLATTWTGAVNDRQKAALLASARALVLCSDSESFGLSVTEAMAAGTPVVVTDTCPWEEIETEGAGFWVPHTSGAIANALDELLDDEDAARAMGARGRALVARRYTWEASARALVDGYQRIAGRRGALAQAG